MRSRAGQILIWRELREKGDRYSQLIREQNFAIAFSTGQQQATHHCVACLVCKHLKRLIPNG
jgi:hypothetical protein